MVHAKLYLQKAATTNNGTAYNCKGDAAQLGFYIVPTGTIAGGVVQIETADTTTYTGTWWPLFPAVTLATGVCTYLSFTGPLSAVRARISTDVSGGGTVNVRLIRSS